MELQTQLTPAKTQIDVISRLEYNNGTITVYFSKYLKIGEDKTDAVFDICSPIKLEVAKIQDALDAIFTAALQARAKQLAPTPADATIVIPPDYRDFTMN